MTGAKTNAYFRSTYREEVKRQSSKNEHPLEFSKGYVARPVEANQNANSSFGKCLYQSKSSARLRPMRCEEEIEREVGYLKQQRNRRMHNNANILQRYEQRAKKQNIACIPRSTVPVVNREQKENRPDKSIQMDKKKQIQQCKERNDKSRSPIRSTLQIN